MAANDANRPSQRGGTNNGKDSDQTGSHAKVGFPGKLQAARSTAPDGASDEMIQNVAWVAHERDCDPRDVWSERENTRLDGYGGDA